MQKIIGIITISIFTLIACTNKEIVYSENENGLRYFYFEKGDQAYATPKENENLLLNVKYYANNSDSLLFTSDYAPNEYRIKLKKPSYSGGQSIEDALAMMHPGDSMCFLLKGKDFYEKTRQRRLPTFMADTEDVRFHIRLIDIQSDEMVQKSKVAFTEKKRKEEQIIIDEYIANNFPNAKQYPSGLYHIIHREGKGNKPQKGDFVSLHYIGKIMNGEEFYNSYTSGIAYSFTKGEVTFVPGMNEAIDSMKVGEKSTFILPSKIGFDQEEIVNIPPFSTLIFDIELLDIAQFKK